MKCCNRFFVAYKSARSLWWRWYGTPRTGGRIERRPHLCLESFCKCARTLLFFFRACLRRQSVHTERSRWRRRHTEVVRRCPHYGSRVSSFVSTEKTCFRVQLLGDWPSTVIVSTRRLGASHDPQDDSECSWKKGFLLSYEDKGSNKYRLSKCSEISITDVVQ